MAPPQPLLCNEAPQVYPVPLSGPPGQVPMPGFHPQDPGVASHPFQPQSEQLEAYPGAHQQHFPSSQEGQMSPHTYPSQVPHSPIQIVPLPLQIPQHMPPSPSHMPPMEQPSLAPPEMQSAHQFSLSPPRSSYTPQMDLYDHMANMVSIRHSYAQNFFYYGTHPFKSMAQKILTYSIVFLVPQAPGRTRTISQSSMHMVCLCVPPKVLTYSTQISQNIKPISILKLF